MKIGQVVIGSCFGDEGKGLMTDHLAGEADLVVRFNGGAQAGHTVTTPDGERHIFSHFGSGTLRGVQTYLSTYFVANPILFRQERVDLVALGVTPEVYISHNNLITTPWDMMLNQFVEQARGKDRHGSVGVGFGETIERCQYDEFATLYGHSMRMESFGAPERKLQEIRSRWVPFRARQLGLTLSDEQLTLVYDDGVMASFIEDLKFFHAYTSLALPTRILQKRKRIVFEGAQGLMLDQKRGVFPHVTRSHTGLTNVMELARMAQIDQLDVHYMTRSYLTRHGAGPLHGEVGTSLPGAIDLTNIPNDWQGTMRYAPFDARLVASFINDDLSRVPATPITLKPHITMTCCDQQDALLVGKNLARLQTLTDIYDGHMSWGPTRNTLSKTGLRRAA